MLALEDKCLKFSHLMARVIDPARIELHEKADAWFEMDTITKKGKVTQLVFKIIKASQMRQRQIEIENMKNILLYWCSDRFNFKDGHKDGHKKTLLGMLTPENTQSVYLKVAELHEYINVQQKVKDIKSLPDYVLKSIQQMLAETAESVPAN